MHCDDPLTFDNRQLGSQLLQMQDDYKSLQEDFQSMREYFNWKIAHVTAQLEEQCRAAGEAEGKANCLQELLEFHEDQGQLAGSYWRTQCEKRDDSIRFLTLKLQEYTVPSHEYCARRETDSVAAGSEAVTLPQSDAETKPQSGGDTYRRILEEHAEVCRDLEAQEEERIRMQHELDACRFRCAGLIAERDLWYVAAKELAPPSSSILDLDGMMGRFFGSSESASRKPPSTVLEQDESCDEAIKVANLEAESSRLTAEIEDYRKSLADAGAAQNALPGWATRCAWRGELDVRAGQLERISLQFDATKRALDDANVNLQWQATSAESLRVRHDDLLRAIKGEEQKVQELKSERDRSEMALRSLLDRLTSTGDMLSLPLACHNARWLLEMCGQKDANLTADETDASAVAANLGEFMPGGSSGSASAP